MRQALLDGRDAFVRCPEEVHGLGVKSSHLVGKLYDLLQLGVAQVSRWICPKCWGPVEPILEVLDRCRNRRASWFHL